ncbi:MAG: hypothetical protein S4CHLAM102_16040 [Chlamydiia bacterium]|nr:hypothetical protein [Chlamydiia bacterium]
MNEESRLKRFIALLLSVSALVSAENQLIYDQYFSPYAAGEDWITVHDGFSYWEDQIYSDKARYSRKPSNGFVRFGLLFFIWGPLNELMVTTNHEVFGHGYRIRTLGSDKVSLGGYSVHAPFPYGLGGGSTSYATKPGLSISDEIAIAAGGVEADMVFANRIRMHWIGNNSISANMSSLYWQSALDLSIYLLLFTDEWTVPFENGHDMAAYQYWLNTAYPQDPISQSSLRSIGWTNLADPFIYYSLYEWFYYIVTGKSIKVPMIPLTKELGYLPAAKANITPFGPEFYFDNLFRYQSHPIYAYIRYGHNTPNNYWGFGIEYPHVLKLPYVTLGFTADFWKQPHYRPNSVEAFLANETIGDLDPANNRTRYGGAASLISHIYWKENTSTSLFAQLGWKSAGYQPGYPLGAKAILRGGLAFAF